MYKPRSVITKVEVRDGVNIRAEESFEDELTHVLISVFIPTEFIHVEYLDGRALLDDLSEETYHRQSSCLTQKIHATQF